MPLEMNASLQFLLLLSPMTLPNSALGSRSKSSCVELNFKAAELQSGVSCTLLNAVVNGGDFLDPDIKADIDITCGFHLENERPTCVTSVVEVADGFSNEECEVSGGKTVANFIETVNKRQESYAFLTKITCRQQCFARIQRAINHCNDDRGENCMSYLTCDCAEDLLSMFEFLPEDATSVFPQFEGVLDNIEDYGFNCRCDALNNLVSELEPSLPCALPREIVSSRDVLAGNDVALLNTCNVASGRTCVWDVVDAVVRLEQSKCEVTGNSDFIYTTESFSRELKSVINFACRDIECYMVLRKCFFSHQGNITECLLPISRECKADWLSFIEGLSPEFKQEFLRSGANEIDEVQKIIDECTCDELNAKAASLQTEGFCEFAHSIGATGYMFADEWIHHQRTCLEPEACISRVTDAISQIDQQGCALRQNTDETAMFLYNVKSHSSDLKELTSFTCNEPNDGCYNDLKFATEDCKQNITYDCIDLASSHCLDTFLDMLARLSDDARDKFLGMADISTLRRNKEEVQNEAPSKEAIQIEAQIINACPLAMGDSHVSLWLLNAAMLSLLFATSCVVL